MLVHHARTTDLALMGKTCTPVLAWLGMRENIAKQVSTHLFLFSHKSTIPNTVCELMHKQRCIK